MSKDEIRLIELLISTVEGLMIGHAGLLNNKTYTDECFRRCNQIDEAFLAVKKSGETVK